MCTFYRFCLFVWIIHINICRSCEALDHFHFVRHGFHLMALKPSRKWLVTPLTFVPLMHQYALQAGPCYIQVLENFKHRMHPDHSLLLLSLSLSKTSLKTLSQPISLKIPCHFFIHTHWVQLVLHRCTWAWDHKIEYRQTTGGQPPNKSNYPAPRIRQLQWLMEDRTSITPIPPILVFIFSLSSSSYSLSSLSSTILPVS